MLNNLPHTEMNVQSWSVGSIKTRNYKLGEYEVQVIEYEGMQEIKDYDLYINGKFFKGEDTPN
jgi:hypothetical protein